MMHVGAVLNIGAFSTVVIVGVMVNDRDLAHEFWDIDGEVVGVRLKKRSFLNFAGTGICSIRSDEGGAVRLSVGRINLHRVHS
jgi:hypothetical protein